MSQDGTTLHTGPSLTMDQYTEAAGSFAVYPSEPSLLGVAAYPAVLLASEAGEVLGHLSKGIRDSCNVMSEERRTLLLKELGDCLWALTMMAFEMRSSLDEVARLNLEKLNARAIKGTIRGSGDNR